MKIGCTKQALLAAVAFSLLLIPTSAQQSDHNTELVVAAAADLNPALHDIALQFEKKTGVHVKLSFGASGAITQQIQNGAPFDVFFSADLEYPQRLITQNQADATSLYKYALGKLVLWVPANSRLDVQRDGMKVLLDPSVTKIAIANPQHAPYGRAAAEALRHAGLYDRVSARFVMGENISQTAQFVESGNAQAGFVALAHAMAPAVKDKGKFWIVPADYYPPLEQAVVIVTNSKRKTEAQKFLDFIKTAESQKIFKDYGFTLPQS